METAAIDEMIDSVDMGSEYTDKQQYLTFMVDGEYYGVDILQVQEIRGWGGVRDLPDMPTFIKGVLDLRGTIVPIIDLRERFGLDKVEYDKSTVIIIVNLQIEQGDRVVGVVVDSVSDVLHVAQDAIKPVENLSAGVDVKYINGMVSVDDSLVVLLDSNTLFGSDLVTVPDV